MNNFEQKTKKGSDKRHPSQKKLTPNFRKRLNANIRRLAMVVRLFIELVFSKNQDFGSKIFRDRKFQGKNTHTNTLFHYMSI